MYPYRGRQCILLRWFISSLCMPSKILPRLRVTTLWLTYCINRSFHAKHYSYLLSSFKPPCCNQLIQGFIVLQENKSFKTKLYRKSDKTAAQTLLYLLCCKSDTIPAQLRLYHGPYSTLPSQYSLKLRWNSQCLQQNIVSHSR